MTVEETHGVTQELASPQQPAQDEASAKAAAREARNERNWSEMRRQKDELARQAKMQEEIIAKLLAQQQAQPQHVEEQINVSDDDYVQGSQVKKLVSKAEENAKKVARQEAERLIQERDNLQFMDKLKRKFDDFDDVVNPETLSMLETEDPDLAYTISELKDPYKIGIQSYKYIKAMGIEKNVSSHRREKEVEKRIEDNKKTVQSPIAFEKRPMAQAFKVTAAEKKQLYDEMVGYARMSGGY